MSVLRYICVVLVLMFSAGRAMAADHFVLWISEENTVSAGSSFTVTATMYNDSARSNFDGSKYLTGTSTASKPLYGISTPIIPSGTVTFTSGTARIPGFFLFNAIETSTITVSSRDDGMAGTLSQITVSPSVPPFRFNVAIENNGTKTAGVGALALLWKQQMLMAT